MMNTTKDQFNLGRTAPVVQDSEPSGSEVQQGNTSDFGVSRLPKSKRVNYYTGRKPTTRSGGAKRKWSKEDYKFAVECKLRAEMHGYTRGTGKVALKYWEEGGKFEMTENKLMNQTRMILRKGWLTPLETESIKRKIERSQPRTETPGSVGPGLPIKAPFNEIPAASEAADVREEENRNINESQGVENTVEERAQGVEESTPESENPSIEMTENEVSLANRMMEIMKNIEKGKIFNCKNINKNKLRNATESVNKIMAGIHIRDLTGIRDILQAGAILVGEMVGAKDPKTKGKKEPYWKRRIMRDLERLRKDLGRIQAWFQGQWKKPKEGEKDKLNRRYRLREKGFRATMEEIKQRIVAKAAKIKRYTNRIKQFNDNRLFNTNQSRFFKNLEGKEESTIAPNPQDATRYWSNIWSGVVTHREEAEWIERVERKLQGPKQEDISISMEDLKKQLKTIPKWKGPGPDGIQGYWLKSFTAIHEKLASHLKDCVDSSQIPEWLVEGRTVLIMKDPTKGTEVGNYRPIACLNILWKTLTGIFNTKVYDHLERNGLLPVEQKGSRKRCLGTKDQLAIDKCILKNCKRRRTNLNVAWIDYRKAYDMVPHSWVVKTLEMVGVAGNLINVVKKSMRSWKTNLFSDGKLLGTVSINRGIFQGDSFSPLLFVIALLPLTQVLRETEMGYQLEKNGPKISHMLFMDDLKLFGKTDNEIDSLVQTVQQWSADIKMEFGISKCAAVALKRGKRSKIDNIILPNGEQVGDPGTEGYKYLGVLELDTILCNEMKTKVKETYLKRLRLLLKSRLNGRNLFLAINSWAVAVVRYSAAFVAWTQDDMKQLDRDTRRLLVKFGALHPKSNVLRLYMKREKGGRGLKGIEECVGEELRSVHYYVTNSQEVMLAAVMREEGLKKEDIENKQKYKERIEKEKMAELEKMKLHGQFERNTKAQKSIDTWEFLRKGDLKRETENLIFAAQEQALNTNAITRNLYGKDCTDRCRLCGDQLETVAHIVSACSTLAQKEYKRRHDKVCINLHWNLCQKYGLQVCDKWYQHHPDTVTENNDVKILWDFMVQCDRQIVHRKPDIIVIDKNTNECQIIDVACPSDVNLTNKKNEKLQKYQELRVEISRLWNKRTTIIPIIIGALGSVPNDLKKQLDSLGIKYSLSILQKSVLLGTANILRHVLAI